MKTVGFAAIVFVALVPLTAEAQTNAGGDAPSVALDASPLVAPATPNPKPEPSTEATEDQVPLPRTEDGRAMAEHFYELLPPDQEDPDPSNYPALEGFEPLPVGWIELRRKGARRNVRVKLFNRNGRMAPAALKKIDELLKDLKNKRRRRMNHRLVALLYLVAQHYNRPLEIVSGYRVKARRPKRRRRRRRSRRRRPSRSHHTMGEAADFRIPGVPAEHVAHFIQGRFEGVGVGYYPTSRFVHIDERGRSYYWIDFSGPGQRQRLKPVPVERTPPRGSDWSMKRVRLPAELRPPKKVRKWAAKKKKRGKKKRRGRRRGK